ncbi:hypothetical protein ACRS6B_16375 [Nocardia asteroides]
MGSAVLAGVLAASATIYSIAVVADAANDEHVPSDLPDFSGLIVILFTLLAALTGLVALLYLLGAFLLLEREQAGRLLVVIASVLGMAAVLLGFGRDLNVGAIAVSALCATPLVFAAASPTGRWIASGKQASHPHQGSGCPPYPNY